MYVGNMSAVLWQPNCEWIRWQHTPSVELHHGKGGRQSMKWKHIRTYTCTMLVISDKNTEGWVCFTHAIFPLFATCSTCVRSQVTLEESGAPSLMVQQWSVAQQTEILGWVEYPHIHTLYVYVCRMVNTASPDPVKTEYWAQWNLSLAGPLGQFYYQL